MSNAIIAIFTVVIAVSTAVQALISQRQYKMSLFERRYKSYLKIKKYIDDVLVDAKKAMHGFNKFKAESITVSLIFGNEIYDKVNRISSNILDFQRLTFEKEDLEKGPGKVKANLELLQMRQQLCNDMDNLKSDVKPYLDLPKDLIISFHWLKEAKWWFLLAGLSGLISLSNIILFENLIRFAGVAFACVGIFMFYNNGKSETK